MDIWQILKLLKHVLFLVDADNVKKAVHLAYT